MKLGVLRPLRSFTRPIGRRIAGVSLVAPARGGWAVRPASPAVSWEFPGRRFCNACLAADGRTIVRTISDGPTQVCDTLTGRPRFELFRRGQDFWSRYWLSPDG